MRQGIHIPLWLRILMLATLNVAILGVVFAVFLRLQLKPEFESFFMAEARERIASITRSAASDLQNSDMAEWDSVMKRYSDQNGVTVLLYRNTGEQLAGLRMPLPPEIDSRMPKGGPPSFGVGPTVRSDRGTPLRGLSDGRDGPPTPGPPRGDRGRRGPPPDDFGRGRGDRGGGRGGSGGGPTPNDIGAPFLAVTTTSPRYWVGVRMPVIRLDDYELRSVLMFVSPTFYTNPFFFDLRPWVGVAAGVLVISALCWLPLMRNLTHSIADMMRATGRIADGRFDVALDAKRHDELGRLGRSIQTMAGRLETLTDGRKRFLGAVAHELRSPIARMQLAVEILQRDTPAAAQKYVTDLKEDIAMMSTLTDELLQFARVEAKGGPLKLEPVTVRDAVASAIRREGMEENAVRVNVNPEIQVRANSEYLVRSLANLLRNARRYAAGSGPIDISAHEESRRVQIVVGDHGPGVPDPLLDAIFTPFFRLEDARDRQSGGTGLGLAIVRGCIEACGGTVECRNRKPSGLEVVMWLPSKEL